MKSSRLLFVIVVLSTASTYGARVDMDDPRRALGREDDVRVDAQLFEDALASNGPIRILYQIQNHTSHSIAVADRVCGMTYDSQSRTITVSIGAEVPADESMPHLVTIAPGETKVFNAGTMVRVLTPSTRSPFACEPRFVQIKVNILRDTTPFAGLIAQQQRTQAPVALSDDLFDRWLDLNDAIYLNTIPVQWSGQAQTAVPSADQRGPGF